VGIGKIGDIVIYVWQKSVWILAVKIMIFFKSVFIFSSECKTLATFHRFGTVQTVVSLESKNPRPIMKQLPVSNPGVLPFKAKTFSFGLQSIVVSFSAGAAAIEPCFQPSFVKQLATLPAHFNSLVGAEEIVVFYKQVPDNF
jgi:hypothetical protein